MKYWIEVRSEMKWSEKGRAYIFSQLLDAVFVWTWGKVAITLEWRSIYRYNDTPTRPQGFVFSPPWGLRPIFVSPRVSPSAVYTERAGVMNLYWSSPGFPLVWSCWNPSHLETTHKHGANRGANRQPVQLPLSSPLRFCAYMYGHKTFELFEPTHVVAHQKSLSIFVRLGTRPYT